MEKDPADNQPKRSVTTPEKTPAEPFSLARWSARKRQVEDAATDLATTNTSTNTSDAAEPTPAADEAAPAELTDADMPPLESIDQNSDVSGFFSPKVSAELRRLALRKLFHTPLFNVRDGLNDYDDDYTTFEPLGDIMTSDRRHLLEVKEARRAEAEAEAKAKADADAETQIAGTDDRDDDTEPALTEPSPAANEHDNNSTTDQPSSATASTQDNAVNTPPETPGSEHRSASDPTT